MRILILGPSGQIGYELSIKAKQIAEVVSAGRSAADIIMDVLDYSALEKLFVDVKPDIVINAIAYTVNLHPKLSTYLHPKVSTF